MGYSSLTFGVEDGVGLIRLNRPNDGNAIILEMARELLHVATLCDENPEVRAVVLTGNGKMFCAGGDLKVFAAQGRKRFPLPQGDYPGSSRSDIPVQLDGCTGCGGYKRNRGGRRLQPGTDHRYRHCRRVGEIHHGLHQGCPGPGRQFHLFPGKDGGPATGQGDGAVKSGIVSKAGHGMGAHQSRGRR